MFGLADTWGDSSFQLEIEPASHAAPPPKYSYRALSSTDSAIRLITIQAPDGSHDYELMACSMEEVPLASAPSFTALSYAWDSEHGTDPTICDGGLIYVTKNCVAALRNVCKDKSTNKRMWVDAICINQAATAKKGRAIRLTSWATSTRR